MHIQLHEKECKENATLKALEAKRNTATKASKNLITAIEQGIITEQTKIRLKELETEISELSVAIKQEKLHSYTYLTVPMIEEFLRSATIGDIQDTNVRKHIVNTFIREVIYYPDKIIITLNFTDNYDKPELTSEHIENIEKQSKSETAFPLPKSSNKFTSFPPKNPIAIAMGFFYPSRRLGISSRACVHIINNGRLGSAFVVYHHAHACITLPPAA